MCYYVGIVRKNNNTLHKNNANKERKFKTMKKRILTGILTMTMVVATMLTGCGSTKETTVEPNTETVEQTTDTTETVDVQDTDIADETDTESTETTDATEDVPADEPIANEYTNLVYNAEQHSYTFNSMDKISITDNENRYKLYIEDNTTSLDNCSTIQELALGLTKEYETGYNNLSESDKKMLGLTTYEVFTIDEYDFLKITNKFNNGFPDNVSYVYPLLVNGSYVDKTERENENIVHFVKPINAGNATEVGDYNIMEVGLSEKGLVEALNLLY